MKSMIKIILCMAVTSGYVSSFASLTSNEQAVMQQLKNKFQNGTWDFADVNRYLDMGGDPNISVSMQGDEVGVDRYPLVVLVFNTIREDNIDHSLPLAKRLIDNEKTHRTIALLRLAITKNQPELFVQLLKLGVKPDGQIIARIEPYVQNSAAWKYIADNWQEWQEKDIEEREKELKRIILLEQEARKLTEELEKSANKATSSGSNMSSKKK